MLNDIVSELQQFLSINDVTLDNGSVVINKNNIVRAIQFLKNEKEFYQLTDLFAVDLNTSEQRFALFYCLLNHDANSRITIKTFLEDGEAISSISGIFKNADFYEREIFDMFGVMFFNHPDLRKILTVDCVAPMRKS